MAKPENSSPDSLDDSASGVSLNTVAPSSASQPDDSDRTHMLSALRIIQSESHRRGEKVLAETYRESYPALRHDPDAFLEILANEIALRAASGDLPSREDYIKRLPEHEAWLRRQFALLQEVRSSLNQAASSGSVSIPDASLLTRMTPPKPPVRRDADRTPPQVPPKPAAATPPSPPSSGKGTRPNQIDRNKAASITGYEILGELGRGGMGVVYKAKHLLLNRIVALKMILGGKHVGLEELARFRTEAEAVARIKHPNIVQIYDIGETDGRPYFSLEFVDGPSLDKKLAGTPVADEQAAAVIEQLARAIHAAHQAGIVHRDLKPANVLLSTKDEGPSTNEEKSDPSSFVLLTSYLPKITDFGLAKRLEAEDGYTQSGAIMGTPSYMAPEQAAGDIHGIGPAADVYALGAVLYELLTGRPSFKGATMWDTLDQVRTREPVPPSRLQAKVSRDLETICLKCLEKDPKKRYDSAESLADDLHRFLNHEPILARPAGAFERAVKWARRRPKEAGLIGLVFALLLSVVGGFVGYHIHLEFALAEAREQVRVAKERERLESVRSEAQAFLSRAQGAFQAGDLPTAKLQLANARERVDAEPGLADVRPQLDSLAAETDRFERFLNFHNEALFYATLFTGLDTSVNLQKTEDAARQALELFAVKLDSDAPPALDHPLFTDVQKSTIRESCYELLLVLADARAYPLPDDPPEKRRARAGEALTVLDRAAKSGLQTRALHLRRARYLAQQGDKKSADAEREKGMAIQPSSAVDFFLVGEDASKRGDYSQAQRDFERALDRQPDHYWAQYYHAVGCLRQQRPAEARTGLTACISRRPDFVWSYLIRGLAHGELGRAAATEADAAGEFAAAEADFQRVLDRQPDTITLYGLHANRGAMRVRQGKLPEGIADLRKAIEIKPGSFQAYVNLAKAFGEQGQYQDSIAELTRAIERDPRQPAVYRERALMYLKTKDLDAALADYEQAIKHEAPRSMAMIEAHIGRGKIYQDKKEQVKAVAAFDDALRIRPDFAPAHRLRAESLLLLNRIDDALVSLDICIQQEKPGAALYRARAQARAKVGRLADAVDDYTRALELEPDPVGYSQRGWSYLLLYDAPRLALRDFEAALKLDPTHADAYNGRGTCRVMLGAFPLGTADAEEAVRRAADAPRLIYKSARIFAIVVGKLEADALKGDRKAVELRGQCLDRALELLKQSLKQLPAEQRPGFWKELVESDTAFSSIRRAPGYGKLLAEYGKTTK